MAAEVMTKGATEVIMSAPWNGLLFSAATARLPIDTMRVIARGLQKSTVDRFLAFRCAPR